MLTLPLTQIETRQVDLVWTVPDPVTLPLAIGAAAGQVFLASVTVPLDEHWFVIGIGASFDFDNKNVQVESAGSRVVGPNETDPLQGTIYPASISNNRADSTAILSLSLQGAEIPAGHTVNVIGSIVNFDSGGGHTINAMSGRLLVRPARIMSSIETASLQQRRGEVGNLLERFQAGSGR